MNTILSSKAKSAIAKYGIDNCLWAYEEHEKNGSGANTIGFFLNMTTQQADAAINAGRELNAKQVPEVDWAFERREEARLDAMYDARYSGDDD
jgi:hypothetical protein